MTHTFIYRCPTCNTRMTIETELESKYIHQVPPCPCGKARMNKEADYIHNVYTEGSPVPENMMDPDLGGWLSKK